jgi:hypothetical protein
MIGLSYVFHSHLQYIQITDSVHEESLSTSALLYYCQCKILRPYSRLLCIMGLRPSPVENTEHCCIMTYSGYKYLVLVLVLMCMGYVLQYMTCFRSEFPPWECMCLIILSCTNAIVHRLSTILVICWMFCLTNIMAPGRKFLPLRTNLLSVLSSIKGGMGEH